MVQNCWCSRKFSSKVELCTRIKVGASMSQNWDGNSSWFLSQISFSPLVYSHPIWIIKALFGLPVSVEKLRCFSWSHFPITFFSHIHQIVTVIFLQKIQENAIQTRPISKVGISSSNHILKHLLVLIGPWYEN